MKFASSLFTNYDSVYLTCHAHCTYIVCWCQVQITRVTPSPTPPPPLPPKQPGGRRADIIDDFGGEDEEDEEEEVEAVPVKASLWL